MTRAAVTSAVTLALAALAIGCGGGDDDSEEDQVRSALEDFASANLDGDWAAACDALTTEVKEGLDAVGRNRGVEGGCEETLKTGVGELPQEQLKKEFEDIEVTAIKVNERQLTATAKVNGQTTSLSKGGDQWLIDVND